MSLRRPTGDPPAWDSGATLPDEVRAWLSARNIRTDAEGMFASAYDRNEFIGSSSVRVLARRDITASHPEVPPTEHWVGILTLPSGSVFRFVVEQHASLEVTPQAREAWNILHLGLAWEQLPAHLHGVIRDARVEEQGSG
jgi:hypothetical protein